MNAEFQRIASRDKKVFFSDQCKETEENNRMGKTRDFLKKIRDTKGTFHAAAKRIPDRDMGPLEGSWSVGLWSNPRVRSAIDRGETAQ